jgi:carbonic anhydrase/acetyltransferase-like protein (isoleucine patch superfamily)
VPQIHADAYIHPDAVVIGDVRIGAESSVWPNAVLRGDYGTIIVGERTSIQDGTVVHAVDEYPTVIGDDCVIGHLAHLEGCVIHNRALVGSGSIVLHEAVVQSGATVGAGAVVRNRMEVPANAMALGVPAQLKLDSCNESVALASAALYAANGRRYKAELRKL